MDGNPLRLPAARLARVRAIENLLAAGAGRARVHDWVTRESGWQPQPSERTIDRLLALAHTALCRRPHEEPSAARALLLAKLEDLYRKALADEQLSVALGILREMGELQGLHDAASAPQQTAPDVTIEFKPVGVPLEPADAPQP